MDDHSGSAFGRICSCGREFISHGALKKHRKSCKRDKKALSGALERLKDGGILSAKQKQAGPLSDVTNNALVENVHAHSDCDDARQVSTISYIA